MGQITNTTKQAADNLMLGLITALPGGIEASEARGQQELIESDQIPTACRTSDAVLKAWGFKLGPPTPGDEIFRQATLPPGWSKRATEHSMWSRIIDDTGRDRAAIFYKAAFYDRSAHMSINCRFDYTTSYPEKNGEPRIVRITDGGSPLIEIGRCSPSDQKESDRLRKQAHKWLETYRPNYQDPMAYWDEV